MTLSRDGGMPARIGDLCIADGVPAQAGDHAGSVSRIEV
jgi:hypothetical protein